MIRSRLRERPYRVGGAIALAGIGAGVLGSAFALAEIDPGHGLAPHFARSSGRPLPGAPPQASRADAAQTTITISAVGDCVLGNDDRFRPDGSFRYYRHTLDKPDDYFFSGVRDILSKDDLTIANAECVIAAYDRRVHKPKQFGGEFWFRGDPGNAHIFAAGSVEAVNLANNHSFDYGAEGLKETVANLQRCGVTPFGCGLKQIVTRKGVRIGLLGYAAMGPLEQGMDEDTLKAQVAADLREMAPKTDLRIVTFHWGVEKMRTPTAQQQRLGHFAVDHGANLVLGHHPHVLQPIETYKGVPIVYSLGDFVYGGSERVLDRNTMIYQHTFQLSGPGRRLTAQSSRVIPCLVHQAEMNDYRPVVASRFCAVTSLSMDTRIPADFVEVGRVVPNAVIDLRYAMPGNVYHHQYYRKSVCYLRYTVANRLLAASILAAAHGLRIKIWDAYRPYSVQKQLRLAVRDPRWIAQGISNHNRGAAVDVTLVDDQGREEDMGTGFDIFSARARCDAGDLTKAQAGNRRRLRSIMTQAGFRPLSTEWWHFDAPDSRRYPPVDAPI